MSAYFGQPRVRARQQIQKGRGKSLESDMAECIGKPDHPPISTFTSINIIKRVVGRDLKERQVWYLQYLQMGQNPEYPENHAEYLRIPHEYPLNTQGSARICYPFYVPKLSLDNV